MSSKAFQHHFGWQTTVAVNIIDITASIFDFEVISQRVHQASFGQGCVQTQLVFGPNGKNKSLSVDVGGKGVRTNVLKHMWDASFSTHSHWTERLTCSSYWVTLSLISSLWWENSSIKALMWEIDLFVSQYDCDRKNIKKRLVRLLRGLCFRQHLIFSNDSVKTDATATTNCTCSHNGIQ